MSAFPRRGGGSESFFTDPVLGDCFSEWRLRTLKQRLRVWIRRDGKGYRMDFIRADPQHRLMSLGEVSKKPSGTNKSEGPTCAPPFSRTLFSDRFCGLARPRPAVLVIRRVVPVRVARSATVAPAVGALGCTSP